jgi:hypothetical protein
MLAPLPSGQLESGVTGQEIRLGAGKRGVLHKDDPLPRHGRTGV